MVRRGRRAHPVDLLDIIAAALPGVGVALVDELAVGALHRDDAHAPLVRQRALRRQARARRQDALQDVVFEPLVYLQILFAARTHLVI